MGWILAFLCVGAVVVVCLLGVLLVRLGARLLVSGCISGFFCGCSGRLFVGLVVCYVLILVIFVLRGC